MAEPSDPPISRQERRKIRTRNSLVSAARKLFLEKGISDTSVNHITETADVAYGTFYNYFTCVEDIVPLVAREELSGHLEKVRELRFGYEDPAMVAALNLRFTFLSVIDDPAMRWLSQRPAVMFQELFDILSADSAATNVSGVEAGRFNLRYSLENLRTFVLWGLIGMWNKVWASPETRDECVDDLTRIHLRLLGVDDDSIDEVIEKMPDF